MSIAEPAALSAGQVAMADFEAIGTTNSILATNSACLAPAVEVAREYLAALDAAVSRFRDDSEVMRLSGAAESGDVWFFASELFNDHLDAALRAAWLSGGLVDFTVGNAVIDAGYNVDLRLVRARETWTPSVRPPIVPGWRRVHRGPGGRVSVPRGTVLDFGATAKAHAADRIAQRLAEQFCGGFLVNLGGDIATAGTAPAGGWRVGVEDADGAVEQVITVTDQAVATSSIRLRRWVTDAGPVHHIIDPFTAEPAVPVWSQVTCVAANALEANTASTAAIILGEEAPAWLTGVGVAARLDRPDGRSTCTPRWPLPKVGGVR